MRKMKLAKPRTNRKKDSSFGVKDADGHVVFSGDFVSLLDGNGLELIDEDTFEDVVKVIADTVDGKAVIDGVQYESKNFRLTK